MKKSTVIGLVIVLLFLAARLVPSQSSINTNVCVGFYNLENLFDTIDYEEVNDSEFTPLGSKKYTSSVYKKKLRNMAYAISKLALQDNSNGIGILGVAEVENIMVLEDLISEKSLVDKNFKIIHYDCKDERGIDVALLYNKDIFKPIDSKLLYVKLPKRGNKPVDQTRGVLWVCGNLYNDTIHVLVNHWPSRGGGAESAENRDIVAGINKRFTDSVLKSNPNAKLIVMGDFNDEPMDKSIASVLEAKTDVSKVKNRDLFNPFFSIKQKGIGTLVHQNRWNLFDQIIVSGSLASPSKGLQFQKARVFKESFLLVKTGKYKGQPKRTYAGNYYLGGYSDHLPVYVVLK